MTAKKAHDLILGAVLLIAAVELVLLPLAKVFFGHYATIISR